MRRAQLLIAILSVSLSLAAPLVVRSDYLFQVLFRVSLFAALGLAWNLVGGYAGQLSLGHAAYFGAGAYGLALFSKAGIHPWSALLLAVLVAVLFAALIGGVSFRLRGPYFTLSTIAFAEVLRLAAKNLVSITSGDVGLPVPGLFAKSFVRSLYLAAVLLTAVTLGITAWVSRSKFGYYLMAIREDEDTALSVGVNAARSKLMVLLLSAALTALGGGLYGSLFLFIVPDQVFSIDISVEMAIVAMLGGAGTILGPLIGAAILESAAELLKNLFHEAHLLIYGILIVLVVLFLPEGITGSLAHRLRPRSAMAAPSSKEPDTVPK
ncbi:MAG TPA: branched-chain amino acid ABC transporter permease [Candidatus Acidoferrales bacterium]|nr:branched-chain amino acid ABC transporter permease [Candidatus Acidoferrales bacterium]